MFSEGVFFRKDLSFYVGNPLEKGQVSTIFRRTWVMARRGDFWKQEGGDIKTLMTCSLVPSIFHITSFR